MSAIVNECRDLVAPIKQDKSLQELLIDMCKYGQPKLSMMDSGWHSWIKVFVPGKGTAFEVRSEFGHTCPLEAVRECFDRIPEGIR